NLSIAKMVPNTNEVLAVKRNCSIFQNFTPLSSRTSRPPQSRSRDLHTASLANAVPIFKKNKKKCLRIF
ncbi:MAG: hypothetical protein OXI59_22265, partial [Gemmatimonadota bacterium]|nr:hypothetical protein [Gemmatimonadota bacterium]